MHLPSDVPMIICDYGVQNQPVRAGLIAQFDILCTSLETDENKTKNYKLRKSHFQVPAFQIKCNHSTQI